MSNAQPATGLDICTKLNKEHIMRKEIVYALASVALLFVIYGYLIPIINVFVNPVTVCCPSHSEFPETRVDLDKEGTEYTIKWTEGSDRSASYLVEKLTLRTDLTAEKITIVNERGEKVSTLEEVGDRETIQSKDMFRIKDGRATVIAHKEHSDYTENYGVIRQGSGKIDVGNIEGVDYYPLKGLTLGSP